MKKLLIFCFLLLNSAFLKSQDINDFTSTDNKINSIPKADTYSADSIARFVRLNFKTEKEKLRAIYIWVTSNIKYDTDSMYAINWSAAPSAKITEALRRRKGVCENYAAIFNDIANKSGLTSFVVDGYTKQGGRIDRTGHSWCAVRLKEEWLLCDPTWDKDAQNNSNYFLISPDRFIETHMPFDPMWQLLNYPLSHRDFREGNSLKKEKYFFNFKDSIKAFSQLTELKQLQAASARMKDAGQISELLKNRVAYTNMQIGLIYEDRDKNFYNNAVADLNSATAVYNDFVQYRNNGFTPAKTDIQIHDLLNSSSEKIFSAYKKINELSVYNSQYDPSQLKDRLDNLTKKIEEQKEFVKKYLAGNEAEKKKLFYQ